MVLQAWAKWVNRSKVKVVLMVIKTDTSTTGRRQVLHDYIQIFYEFEIL